MIKYSHEKDHKSIEEIREILKKHKEEARRKYKVSEIGIFGSFVAESRTIEAIATSSLNSIREISRALSSSSGWKDIWRSFSVKK